MDVYSAQRVNGREKGVLFYFHDREKGVAFIEDMMVQSGQEILGRDEGKLCTVVHGSSDEYGVVEKILIFD